MFWLQVYWIESGLGWFDTIYNVQQQVVLRVVFCYFCSYFLMLMVAAIHLLYPGIMALAGGKEENSLSCHFRWGRTCGFMLVPDLFSISLVNVLIEVLISYLRVRYHISDWSAIHIPVTAN